MRYGYNDNMIMKMVTIGDNFLRNDCEDDHVFLRNFYNNNNNNNGVLLFSQILDFIFLCKVGANEFDAKIDHFMNKLLYFSH